MVYVYIYTYIYIYTRRLLHGGPADLSAEVSLGSVFRRLALINLKAQSPRGRGGLLGFWAFGLEDFGFWAEGFWGEAIGHRV